MHTDHLGSIGDGEVASPGADALRERSDVGITDPGSVAGDGIVERLAVVDLAEDRVLEEHLVAGGIHHRRVEQPPEEQMSVLVHRLAEPVGVVEEMVGGRELGEAIVRSVEGETVRCELREGGRTGRHDLRHGIQVG